MVKQRSDNEIYLLIKYIRSVLWRVVKRLSYIEDAQCLKVKIYEEDMTNKVLFWRRCHWYDIAWWSRHRL